MSARYGAAIGLIILAVGSNAKMRSASAQHHTIVGLGASSPMSAPDNNFAMSQLQERLAQRAPVGHRQPRQSDISAGPELSPLERQLKLEDESIDKKLIICHHC
jgi:hypothetical protein